MSFIAFGAEFRRTFQLASSYWLEYVSEFFLYSFGFLLLIVVFRAASMTYGPIGYLSTLIGYTVWIICASAMQEIAQIAPDEARTGTLEQLFLVGLRPSWVFIGRSMGIFLNYSIRGLIMAAILALILGIWQALTFVAVVVFILTAAGALGMGFALAGLALIYKRVEGMLHLIWQMLVFFTGALAPIQNVYLNTISKALPLTWGIDCLRAIYITGATATTLWQDGLLPGLLVNTAFYVILGSVLFAWGQRQARRLGVLAHY